MKILGINLDHPRATHAITRLLNVFGIAMGPIPRFGLAPVLNPKPPNRAQRNWTRRAWKHWMTSTMRTGYPVLTGVRLQRTIEACSPRHLTVQPEYRRIEFERAFSPNLVDCP